MRSIARRGARRPPAGETQTVLSVPKDDFNWQLFYYYQEPILLPKGTRIECTAHFDNSPNNKYNPDPKAEVRWGEQTWEEMMIGWFDLAVDAGKDPVDVFRERTREASKAPVHNRATSRSIPWWNVSGGVSRLNTR